MRQQQDTEARSTENRATKVPLLPFKNVVIFPRNVVTLLVVRPRSIHAVEEAMIGDRKIAITAHRDPENDDPGVHDLHEIGTYASILSAERQQSGNLQVVLEGVGRVRLSQIENSRPFFQASARDIPETQINPDEAGAYIQHVQALAARYAESRESVTPEVLDMIQRASTPGHLSDLIATQLISDVPKRQELLETADPVARLELIGVFLSGELDVVELESRIRQRVNDQMDKTQRDYYLRAQLDAIHAELDGEEGNEFQQLKAKITGRGMPGYAEEKLLKELARLERMPGVSAEATVVRSYIETMLALPWYEFTEDQLDLGEASRILNEDHYGMETVKERMIEFLAVRKLTQQNEMNAGSQILCLVGPPGVGKTSLGRSVAASMGREFVRVSLGGVRDEAEIRGHRRTYIGAMPGRIITALKSAGSINPVVMLDEIDKLSSDYRGDPTAAMLEVLDPEQNHAFTDHYLDLPYDLSKALFITTANYAQQIPRPLRDRMEMIEVSGYTEQEKTEIAQRHLLHRQLPANGLDPSNVELHEDVWREIIRGYTREAGVRGLEREVAKLCRKVATRIALGSVASDETIVPRVDELEQYLGARQFGFEQDLGGSQIGLAIGLGTTEIGGEILPVEVATMPGRGGLTITGQAGDVMQESARAAMSYARSRSDELRIDRDFQEKLDLHIHLSEGATPKDGPSAGITMATAVISALTRRAVRNDTAMTGEITLRGRVLTIGGLRDKALAAHRHGIRRLIAPHENRRDMREVPDNVREEIEFIFVSNMDEVIQAAIMLDVDQADHLQDATERSFHDLPPLQPDIVDAGGPRP